MKKPQEVLPSSKGHSERGTMSYSKTESHGSKSLVNEMEKIIVESDQEIKRLNKTIQQLKQQQKNKILLYQSKIVDLEHKIEQYQAILESKQKSRCSAIQHQQVHKSQKSTKIGPSRTESFWKSSFLENNENINTLNAYIQPCTNPHCAEMHQKVREESEAIARRLEKLVCSIKMKSQSQHSGKEYEMWVKELLASKTRWKGNHSKSSLFLLRQAQNNIEQLQGVLGQDGRQVKEPLVQALSKLKARQTSLMKIPFLQRVQVEERKQEYRSMVKECRSIQLHLNEMMK